MLDARVYRAGLVPALLALILVAFSLEDRPRPLRTTISSDAFDGRRAFAELEGLAAQYRDRRAGEDGDVRLGQHVERTLRQEGFTVRRTSAEHATVEGDRVLSTVAGERTGADQRRVVVVAHRDAAEPGSRAELSGTAALLELARVFGAPRTTRRTVTLVSTSGGSGGAAAARELPRLLGGPVQAVIVVGDLASERLRRPLVVDWSDGLGAAPLRLRRTVEEAVRLEAGTDPGGARALVQAVRFALPGTLGQQGPLNARGVPAVLLSASGERPAAPDAPVSATRLEAMGRATLRAMTALDRGPDVPREMRTGLLTVRKVLPDWAVRLLVGVLLLGPLIAIVDAFARVRRRRAPVAAGLARVLALAAPLLACALFARLLALVGLVPAAPPGPAPQGAVEVAVPALVATLLVAPLAWLTVRRWLLDLAGARDDDPGGPGPAVAVLLVVAALAVPLWIRNPYAAALLVPVLHLWPFTLLPDRRPVRAVGLLLLAVSLVPVGVVVGVLLHAFGFGPLDALWALFLAVAGGHASPLGWIEASLFAACVLAAGAVAWRGRVPALPERKGDVTMRGPLTYAGPGSLGGVESALRR